LALWKWDGSTSKNEAILAKTRPAILPMVLGESWLSLKNPETRIIVTHNPNLAVVCDADQIIHSHIDKQHKNKVTYTSGALENPKTNALSITVLEGTRPAFVQRDRKYHEEE